MALNYYETIGDQDIRCYAGYSITPNLFRWWDSHKVDIRKIITRLYQCDAKDVCEVGTRLIMYAYFKYAEFTEIVEQECLTDPVRSGLVVESCIEYLSAYGNQYHFAAVKLIVEHLCNAVSFDEKSDNMLYKERIDPKTDQELILELASRNPGRRLLNNLARYIDEEGIDLPDVASALRLICIRYPIIVQNTPPADSYIIHDLETRLPILVKKLYEITSDDISLQSLCLDLWDMMYRNGIDSAWKLMQDINM